VIKSLQNSDLCQHRSGVKARIIKAYPSTVKQKTADIPGRRRCRLKNRRLSPLSQRHRNRCGRSAAAGNDDRYVDRNRQSEN
jgi:hypothetical protein